MRRLILLAFVGAFISVTLSKKYPLKLEWLFGSSKLNDNANEKRTVCESEECKKMADTMLGSMNRSVNPCDDFYEYACGKWPEKHPIPTGFSKYDMMTMLQINVFRQVLEIVRAKPTENDLKAVKLAKEWYKACMDTNAIEKEGIDPLVSILSRLGGWPMIMESDEQDYSWQKVDDQYMSLTGRNAFYDVRIKQYNDLNIVEIDTPHLPPGSKQLPVIEDEDEDDDEGDVEESKSDEDPSDEEEQSHEDESGSEGENDSDMDNDDDEDCGSSSDNDNDDDDDDDGSGDIDDDDGSGDIDDDDGSGDIDDDDDDDDDTDEDEQDEDVKKKMGKKKIIGKIGHKRSKKLRHVGQRKSGTQNIKKYDSHKKNRQRIRRCVIAKVDNKRSHRFIRRKKLHARKGERNHVRKVHRKRTKKISDNEEPHMNSEDTKEMIMLKQYADYILKVANAIAKNKGTKISQERLDEDIQDMIVFQLRLIQIVQKESRGVQKIGDTLFTTLKDFQEWYDKKNPKTAKGKIDWVNKIKALFDEVNEPVDDDLELDIVSSSYIKGLLSLLDETSNRTIVNYIHWNFISRIIQTTTKEMRNLYDSWEKISNSESPSLVRWQICTDSAEIKHILAYEFIRKYFSDDIMKTGSNMISDIQKEVEKLIKESDWMNDDAKDFALAKIKNLKKFIGYPDWYKNTTIIEEYFEGLVIGPSYYENTIRYNRYIKLKSLQKLSKNNNEINKKLIDPTEVNAYYLPWKNALNITAADFQSPWFADGRPRAVNFGIIGFIMAHEVNHGFDNSGYMYNKDGKLLGCFSAMAYGYDKKEDCFVEQFNNYPIDIKTNKKIKDYGKQTISDNIADTMGLQAIFKTFQTSEKESKTPDAALPGMEDFTDNQLFFLSFANLWCETLAPGKLMAIAEKDDHSIGRLRIIGSVSNSDDFAEAYNCPVGSPMNPEKKCNIWK